MSTAKRILHQLHEADTSGFKKIADNVPMATRLNISHHKMEVSGRYELVAYVN